MKEISYYLCGRLVVLLLIALFMGIANSQTWNAFLQPLPSPWMYRISGNLSNPTEPDVGRFLVASEELRDPSFLETVVLLIEYSKDGALGLVINRPTKIKLAEALPDLESVQQRPDQVFLGGPVDLSHMILLIRSTKEITGASRVFDDVYVSSSKTVLKKLLSQNQSFRIYAGYAGWSPGQLDNEIARGDWHVLPADGDLVFSSDLENIWQRLIRWKSMQWVKR